MLIVNVEKSGSIERALKNLKRKFQNTKVLPELRDRQSFTKPSVRRRDTIRKAAWKQSQQPGV